MAFAQEENRIVYTDEAGRELASVTFPAAGEGLVDIDHTFVDPSLRGQGMAGQLMERAANALRDSHRQAVLSCSYAQKWFGQHPEYADVLKP